MKTALAFRAWITAGSVVSILTGCTRPKPDAATDTGAVVQDSSMDPSGSATANKGKIPLSTKSDEAKKLYAEGLTQFDQVRFYDAHQKFQQAAAKDPKFAMAHYQLALTSPSNNEALAQAKATKEAMKYQDKPSGDKQCSNCLQFVAPDGCKVVDGTVSPSGYCIAWVKKA